LDGNILVGNPEELRLLGKSRCRWKDNVEMDLGSRTGKCRLIHLGHDEDQPNGGFS
jgi:hypothetical protein